jgi:hypothetical protein
VRRRNGSDVPHSVCPADESILDASVFLANLGDCQGFSGADFAKFFENTIAAQFANGFVVCGVIIDNLAAQRLGSRQTLAFSENVAVRPVRHIPCFCHTINLVFVNSMKDSEFHTVMATLAR